MSIHKTQKNVISFDSKLKELTTMLLSQINKMLIMSLDVISDFMS